jgi:hypothetical protein
MIVSTYHHFRFALLLAIAAFSICPVVRAAITIDDYSVGPITVTKTVQNAGASALQSGLDPSHVLGGSRSINVGGSGGLVGQSLTINSASERLVFTVPQGSDSYGYFDIGYGSLANPLNLDLSQSHKALQIIMLGTPARMPGIALYSAHGIGGPSIFHPDASVVSRPDGAVVATFPMSSITIGAGFDISAITHVNLGVGRYHSSGSPLQILDFSVVPEPTNFALTAIGVALIYRPRRMNIARHLSARA